MTPNPITVDTNQIVCIHSELLAEHLNIASTGDVLGKHGFSNYHRDLALEQLQKLAAAIGCKLEAV